MVNTKVEEFYRAHNETNGILSNLGELMEEDVESEVELSLEWAIEDRIKRPTDRQVAIPAIQAICRNMKQ